MFLCVYLLVSFHFPLLVLSKDFPVSYGPSFSQQSSFPARHCGQSCGSPAAPSVSLCPAGRAPAVPSATKPPVPPPPWPSPPRSRTVALDLLRAGAGRLHRCPCASSAWHGRADEPWQLLAAKPGSRGEPTHPTLCLGALAGMLKPSKVAA